ncbi:MAG: hypothetical protein HQL95_13410 [Magnetococcales bacterium]|nr:hypothetical protein [Magnetococcales bacterium]
MNLIFMDASFLDRLKGMNGAIESFSIMQQNPAAFNCVVPWQRIFVGEGNPVKKSGGLGDSVVSQADQAGLAENRFQAPLLAQNICCKAGLVSFPSGRVPNEFVMLTP